MFPLLKSEKNIHYTSKLSICYILDGYLKRLDVRRMEWSPTRLGMLRWDLLSPFVSRNTVLCVTQNFVSIFMNTVYHYLLDNKTNQEDAV